MISWGKLKSCISTHKTGQHLVQVHSKLCAMNQDAIKYKGFTMKLNLESEYPTLEEFEKRQCNTFQSINLDN